MRWLIPLLLCAPACTGNVGGDTSPEVTLPIVEAGRWSPRLGSATVSLIDLGGPMLDIVVANPTRFEVDVFAAVEGEWSLVASGFSGKNGANEIVGAHVGGRPVVLARSENEVTLLAGVLGEPHRLRFPVSVYSGRGVLHDIDAADVDGDGDDELLVVGQQGAAIVELIPALDAHPEQPPSRSETETLVEVGVDMNAIGAADIDDDGNFEIVVATPDVARVYRGEERLDIELDAPAEQVARVACSGRGGLLGLAGGERRQIAAASDGYRLVAAEPADRLASSDQHLATLVGIDLTIREPCGAALGSLVVRDATDFALGDELLVVLGDELIVYEVGGASIAP
ncbi:MAG TPA: hypothetical protein VFB62_09375 [Polyangiaceae bacterium]|jgi:hypothetical protein|nr:hypothetical protein [Polyangiaceae bacterium]